MDEVTANHQQLQIREEEILEDFAKINQWRAAIVCWQINADCLLQRAINKGLSQQPTRAYQREKDMPSQQQETNHHCGAENTPEQQNLNNKVVEGYEQWNLNNAGEKGCEIYIGDTIKYFRCPESMNANNQRGERTKIWKVYVNIKPSEGGDIVRWHKNNISIIAPNE